MKYHHLRKKTSNYRERRFSLSNCLSACYTVVHKRGTVKTVPYNMTGTHSKQSCSLYITLPGAFSGCMIFRAEPIGTRANIANRKVLPSFFKSWLDFLSGLPYNIAYIVPFSAMDNWLQNLCRMAEDLHADRQEPSGVARRRRQQYNIGGIAS